MTARAVLSGACMLVLLALALLEVDSRLDEFDHNMAVIDANFVRIDESLREIDENLRLIEGITTTADATSLSGKAFVSETELAADIDSAGTITDCIAHECWSDLDQLRRDHDL